MPQSNIEKLDSYDLDTGMIDCGGYEESDDDDIKLSKKNMTMVVKKINEIIGYINDHEQK